MYKPMPSPAGTNYERLFISSGPAAAYDSFNGLSPQEYGRRMARRLTGRLAYDAPEPEQNELLSPEYLKVLLDWAKEADLDYEQWSKFNEILKALSDPKGDYVDGSYVSDARRRATGLPRTALDGQPRREMTMAEKRSFDLRFPGVSRLKIL